MKTEYVFLFFAFSYNDSAILCHITAYPTAFVLCHITTSPTAFVLCHITAYPTAFVLCHITASPTAFVLCHITAYLTAFVLCHINAYPTAFVLCRINAYLTACVLCNVTAYPTVFAIALPSTLLHYPPHLLAPTPFHLLCCPILLCRSISVALSIVLFCPASIVTIPHLFSVPSYAPAMPNLSYCISLSLL